MMVTMTREPESKKQKTSKDGDDTLHPIWPTKEGGPMTYGIAYEHFEKTPTAQNWEGALQPDLLGEYDVIYICFDAHARRWYQQEGLYEEESLDLHRTVKGTLVLSQKEGKLHGSLEYAPELKGTLVPSNGSFSFVEEGEKNARKIEYKLKEKFCWADVGTNTGPCGKIQAVGRRAALGLMWDDLSSASKFKFDGGYPLQTSLLYDEKGYRKGIRMAEEHMEKYENVRSSWLCRLLELPPKAAMTIRHFLYPPPMLYIEKGDLVLTTTWDNRDNKTMTIARRRNKT